MLEASTQLHRADTLSEFLYRAEKISRDFFNSSDARIYILEEQNSEENSNSKKLIRYSKKGDRLLEYSSQTGVAMRVL